MSEAVHHYSATREVDMGRVREICDQYRNISPEEALMPVFQEIQEEFGFVNEAACYEVAHQLHLSPTQIYASLTFYWIYKWRPGGKHRIFLCEGSGCYTTGTTKLRRTVEERLGIGAGETTFDGKITFAPFSTCMGACEWSPLVEVDGEFYGFVDEVKLNELIDQILRQEYGGETQLDAPTPNSSDAPTDNVAQISERAPSLSEYEAEQPAESGPVPSSGNADTGGR
jgi:NADH:ubiquinone oxidoreductase subunit E